MSKRPHGKAAFGHPRDVVGDIQVYFMMTLARLSAA
jgi:hypothetical protein